jgi:hypothetical protein
MINIYYHCFVLWEWISRCNIPSMINIYYPCVVLWEWISQCNIKVKAWDVRCEEKSNSSKIYKR